MWNTCACICALWVLQLLSFYRWKIQRGVSLFSYTTNGWSLVFKIMCVICTYLYCLLSTFKCSLIFFYSSVIFSSYSSLGMYISVSDQPTTNIVGPALMHVIMLQLLNCLPVNLFTSRLALLAHLWDSCPISPFSELTESLGLLDGIDTPTAFHMTCLLSLHRFNNKGLACIF